MALLNYTTSIEASKTISEIQVSLQKHGAKAVLINYGDDGVIESLSFQINSTHGLVGIKLPIQPDSILRILSRQNVPHKYRTRPQAIRVAWRIIKDWVNAQMAILETDMVSLEQIFLPYIMIDEQTTVYDSYLQNQRQLTEGNKNTL